jgi:NADH-quinone oxidoreductase subunit N
MTLATVQPFIPNWSELRPFASELWLVASIVAVLLAPFFTRRPNFPCALIALGGLVVALVWHLSIGPQLASPRIATMIVSDPASFFWKALLLIFTIGIVLMWFATIGSSLREGDGPEFFSLLLGATLGMSLMASASNLITIFMSIELASLPSYVLAGFRKTRRSGAEASLKYVLFGAATSSIMIYGLSILYGLYGTLNIYDLAPKIINTASGGALLAVALSAIFVGIGFKIAAVPFHFWCPDVFEGAGVDVAAFLSVASKGAGVLLLMRLLAAIAQAPSASRVAYIAALLGILGTVTSTVGNTAAFMQTNIKRLLAYSSIAHAGYMLSAAALLVRGNSTAALTAVLFYLAVYLFMNLGAFTVAGVVLKQTQSEHLSAFAGLGRRSPILAFCMAAFLLSLIGLPPLAGFLAKLNIMYVLAAAGGWWWALVAAVGLNTVLSLYYYARILKVMYIDSTDALTFALHPLGAALSATCAILLLVMLIAYGSVGALTTTYAKFYVP